MDDEMEETMALIQELCKAEQYGLQSSYLIAKAQALATAALAVQVKRIADAYTADSGPVEESK